MATIKNSQHSRYKFRCYCAQCGYELYPHLRSI